MYNKAISGIAASYLILFIGFWIVVGMKVSVGSSGILTENFSACEEELFSEQKPDMQYHSIEIIDYVASEQRVVDYDVAKKEEYVIRADEEDLEALCRIVEAEAASEDSDGKLLVANVVLNRVKNEKFPNSIKEVILQQKNGVAQFSPVGSGRFYRVEISEETYSAVERALKGEDISEGALFFVARKRAETSSLKWFEENLTFLFEHGGHEFYSY